jgi:outer membrane protein TolC
MRWGVKFFGFWPVWLLAFLLLPSCMVGPDYVRPPTETASQWLEAEDQRLKTTSVNDQDWWKAFNDPILNQLIERAYLSNLGIRVTGLRILEARAQLGIAMGISIRKISSLPVH